MYFVLTAPDVSETSGLDTQYCFFHTHANIAGSDIKYALVGNPERAPFACANGTAPPNGSLGADGTANLIAAALDETVTDPDLNGWYTNPNKKTREPGGRDNALLCNWTFGSTYDNGTGIANMNLGGRDYLIQQNWVNAGGGYCALHYP